MKTNKISYVLIFLLLSLIILISCSKNEDNSVSPLDSKSVFDNPYSFAGQAHNKIVADFLAANQPLELNNILSRSKNFLENNNYYSNISNSNSLFAKDFTFVINPTSDKGLQKVTDEGWIDSLFSSFVANGTMSVVRKNQLEDFVNVVLTANADTNIVNAYCLEVSGSTLDDTTKAIIFMSASIYNASQRLWQNGNLSKQDKIELTIIAADAIGGAIGGAIYGIDAWLSDSDWSWGHFASSVIGGAAFTSIGKVL